MELQSPIANNFPKNMKNKFSVTSRTETDGPMHPIILTESFIQHKHNYDQQYL